MVLRVFASREGWGSGDGFWEENSSSTLESSSVDSEETEKLLSPPPRFLRPVIVVQTEQVPDWIDYSICKQQVDNLHWPSESRLKREQKEPYLRVRDILQGRYCPLRLNKSSDAQDIYRKRVSVADFPIYNSQNTAQWQCPLSTTYPDTREENTWISYKGQMPSRDKSYTPRPKLRNYY